MNMINRSFFIKITLLIALGFCFSISYSQDTSAAQKQIANPSAAGATNYFKIEIGMGILGCPILPVRLKEKILTLKDVKDYHVDTKSQSILFSVPEGVATIEQIKNMAISCSFPATSINVHMNTKPFAN